MITLTINGKKVRAEENTNLLEITRKMSIPVPTLCYHPDLTPQGSCRLCTVEVRQNGRSRLVTACNYPATKGIEVETHSERVLRSRRVLIELLLARSPQATVIKDLAQEFGIEKSRFKTQNLENDCILCGLCVRTCDEIVGAKAIGFSRRGVERQVGAPFDIDSENCVACGACEYVCPTGAIKMEMARVRKIKLSDTGTRRFCRYMRLGLVDFMICSNGFECWRCEVDQKMEDRFDTHPAFAIKPAKTGQPLHLNGFTFFPALLYSANHVWAKCMDQQVRLGLDDLVSPFASEADTLTLPSPGSSLKKDDVLTEIISGKNKVKILSPLEGTVSAVNRDLEEHPRLAWKAPYDRGWLVMMEPDDPEDVSKLQSGQSAKEWFTQQATNLTTLLIKRAEKIGMGNVATPDNGQLIRQIVRHAWDEMRKILFTPSR
jgi:glycine cleavage system H lipoate-binding protein/NAD-dependent dihydropyrimidine dehydrogenase PreA subunit